MRILHEVFNTSYHLTGYTVINKFFCLGAASIFCELGLDSPFSHLTLNAFWVKNTLSQAHWQSARRSAAEGDTQAMCHQMQKVGVTWLGKPSPCRARDLLFVCHWRHKQRASKWSKNQTANTRASCPTSEGRLGDSCGTGEAGVRGMSC